MSHKRDPMVGVLLVAVTAFLFWGVIFLWVSTAIVSHQEAKAIELACDKMIEYGWAISLPDCVEELHP